MRSDTADCFCYSCLSWARAFRKVYENALVHRLRKTGLEVLQQHPIKVFDEDGTLIGEYITDLFVANHLVVELKTAKMLVDEHVAQIPGYLKSSRIEHGLLINLVHMNSRFENMHGRDRKKALNLYECRGHKENKCRLSNVLEYYRIHASLILRSLCSLRLN